MYCQAQLKQSISVINDEYDVLFKLFKREVSLNKSVKLARIDQNLQSNIIIQILYEVKNAFPNI